jgi:hypothetical protein
VAAHMSQEKREERVTEDLRNFTQILTLWQERKISSLKFKTEVVNILNSMRKKGNLEEAYQCFMTIVSAVPKAVARLGDEVAEILNLETFVDQYEVTANIRTHDWRDQDNKQFREQIFAKIKRVFLKLMIQQVRVESNRDDQIDDASTRVGTPILPAFNKTVQSQDVRKKARMMEEKGTMDIDGKTIDEEPETEDYNEEDDA